MSPKKKILIVGCENSHVDAFLKLIRGNKKYSSVDVVGVYSDDTFFSHVFIMNAIGRSLQSGAAETTGGM
jgi:acetaldehyde dehydrogenase (acetylating)